MRRMTAVIAGAAGGAVAIALMELLSERAAFPLMLVPFALDRAGHGLTRDRGGATAPAYRRACGGHLGRAVGGENRWTRGVHGGVGGRPGHGGDASHQELSPSGRNRSPRRRAQRHVLELSPRPRGSRSMPAGRVGLRLAQPFPRPRLARALVVRRPQRAAVRVIPPLVRARPHATGSARRRARARDRGGGTRRASSGGRSTRSWFA